MIRISSSKLLYIMIENTLQRFASGFASVFTRGFNRASSFMFVLICTLFSIFAAHASATDNPRGNNGDKIAEDKLISKEVVYDSAKNSPDNDAGVAFKDIKVFGLQRIERETILSHFPHKMGDKVTYADLDKFMKNLFDTGFFSHVNIEINPQKEIVVRLEENPIVNRVAIEGNSEINDDALKIEMQLRPRVVFTRTKVMQDMDKILALYRIRKGMFAAKVNPKIIKLPDNRVDVVFEINEGKITKIRQIKLIGNKNFSDIDLKSVMMSKEKAWWRFLVSDDTYDRERLEVDKQALTMFYLSKGYVDFKVIYAMGELTLDHSAFIITIKLEEGERYKIGNVGIKTEVSDIDPTTLSKCIKIKSGQWYNIEDIEEIVQAITEELSKRGLTFINTNVDRRVNKEDNTVDLDFVITKSNELYVEEIDICGNVRTLDRVIRREVEIKEGDPFTYFYLNKSEKNIRSLGFFETVNVQGARGAAADKVKLRIKVEEKSTGEIRFGIGGDSVSGLQTNVGYKEANLLGRGYLFFANLDFANRRKGASISFADNEKLNKGIDLSYSKLSRDKESHYEHSQYGGQLSATYDLIDNRLNHSVHYSLFQEKMDGVNLDQGAKDFIKQPEGIIYQAISQNPNVGKIGGGSSVAVVRQYGNYTTSTIGHNFTYSRLDSRRMNADGYYLNFGQDFAGVGGNVKFFKNSLSGGYFYPLRSGWILSIRARAGIITPIGSNKVRIADRFGLGFLSLRGFANDGVGPRDTLTDDALRGLRFYSANAELAMPLPYNLGKSLNMKLVLFSDVGNVWHSTDKKLSPKIVDESYIRASVGFGVSFQTQFLGDIAFYFGFPLRKAPYDKRQVFQPKIGGFIF